MRALCLCLAILLLNGVPVSARETDLQTITAENAAQLTQIARYGDGIPTGSLVWSPDGEWLAVAGSLSTWLYADADFTTPARMLDVVGGGLVFSPDSRLLALNNADGVHLWDIRQNREVTLLDSTAPIAFSPDGKTLATSGRTEVVLWDIATARRLSTHVIENVTDIEHLAFSPDGALLMAIWERIEIACLHGGDFSGIHIWNLAEPVGQDAVEYFQLETLDYLSGLAFSPDGNHIAFHNSESIIVFDRATGAETMLFDRQRSVFVNRIAFGPDGVTLAAIIRAPGGTDSVQLLDADTGEVVKSLDDFGSYLVFSADGTRLAVNNRIWNTDTGALEAVLRRDRFSLTPDGATLLHYMTDNTIRLLDAATGEERAMLPVTADAVREIRYTPDNTAMLVRTRDSLHLIDMETGMEHGVLPIDTDRSPFLSYSASNRLVAVISQNHPTRIWNLESGDEVVVPLEPGEHFVTPYFAPDESLLLFRLQDETGLLRLRDSWTGEETTLAHTEDVAITRVIFTDNGVIILGEDAESESILQVWDTASGEALGAFADIAWDLLAVSPDSLFAAYLTEERGIRLISVETGQEYALIEVPADALLVDQLRFSSDGTKLIIGTQGEGGECYNYDDHVWDIETRTEVDDAPEPTRQPFVTTPNGEVRAPVAHLIQLSDAATGEELARLEGHRGTVNRIVFHPNGQLLLTEGVDGTVIVWGIPPN